MRENINEGVSNKILISQLPFIKNFKTKYLIKTNVMLFYSVIWYANYLI